MHCLPLMVNSKVVKSKFKARLILTSAPPGTGSPGAPGFERGTRSVSESRTGLGVSVVVGSALGAKMYRRIAELTPPVKPVGDQRLRIVKRQNIVPTVPKFG